jgi:septum formation protein
MRDIILASKSKVRKDILSTNGIHCRVVPSNVDEDSVKKSLTSDKASPEIISKNLAELKANKVSAKFPNELVVGADSVIDLSGEVISKPNNRNEAFEILKSLNGKKHHLISSVCISMGGNMIWNYTDKAELFMKKFTLIELQDYLSQISDEVLYAYNVYQIEGLGKTLFSEIKGDNDTIMGLPVKKIKEYLKNFS